MGSGGCCTRRQKGVLQSCLCALAVVGLGLGGYMYSLLKEHVRNSEVLSQKHKQQQESVSAQLQVVYEHRSRLERSLQKERGEHKKTKEDFLVYKLEAQEALNKEKQDSMNRYSALTSQHKIMKSQQDDVRKQLQDLQLQYGRLKLEHRTALEQHSQSQLQKQAEISHLQDSVSNLKEESKQLRRAHQQVHAQLLETEAQMEEFRQLKEALHKIPSLKKPGMNAVKFWEGNQALKGQPRGLGNSHWRVPAQKEPTARPPAGRVPEPGDGNGPGIPAGERRALWAPVRSGRDREESFDQAVRFTRTVNGLRPGPTEMETAVEGVGETLDVGNPRARSPVGEWPGGEQPKPFIVDGPSHETPQPEKAKRWDQVINDVSQQGQAKQNPIDPERRRGQGHRDAQWENMLPAEDDEDLEIEDEFDEPDEKSLLRRFGSRKKSIVQEPLIPGAEQDPAQDPNNQGEDEFEEAEVQQPGFADKGALDSGNQHDLFLKQGPKGPDGAGRNGDEGMEDYRDEQEAGMEDHAGEVEDDTNLID